MKFLINATNIKNGGGLQVTDSLCRELPRFEKHTFIVVLSSALRSTGEVLLSSSDNVTVINYDMPHKVRNILFARDNILDNLIEREQVNAVLTVFGPSLWRPRVPHLCGFARAQLLLKVKGYRLIFKERLLYAIWAWAFRRSSDTFYTENAYISNMLPKLIKGAEVYTVTNYYNQVFDHPEQWRRNIKLPSFNGVTMLTVSSTASHKNLGIMVPVANYLKREYPNFNFRFVLTCEKAPFQLPEDLKKYFLFVGKVDVSECPYLYEQASIMFMPTLMECFTATYPEAMRMQVPIVTTDLEFARGLCGDAACYYSAVEPKAAAEAIYKVASDKEYTACLVENGKKQLLTYDSYEERADKLVKILEKIAK